MRIIIVLTVVILALQSSAQILIRTNTIGELSTIGVQTEQLSYAENLRLEESLYYRFQKNNSGYNIHSIYKRDSMLGACLYGREINLMKEHFEKNSGNTFRYWNKFRMGFKVLLEESIYTRATGEFWDYLDGEMYISYIHLPKTARGDQRTRYRRGSFMVYLLGTGNKRFLAYMKYNFGSVWLKGYYKQENRIPCTGLYVEWEINKNGYNHSLVNSSRDIYHGLLVFGGPEYNINLQQVSLNLGIKITTENH